MRSLLTPAKRKALREQMKARKAETAPPPPKPVNSFAKWRYSQAFEDCCLKEKDHLAELRQRRDELKGQRGLYTIKQVRQKARRGENWRNGVQPSDRKVYPVPGGAYFVGYDVYFVYANTGRVVKVQPWLCAPSLLSDPVKLQQETLKILS